MTTDERMLEILYRSLGETDDAQQARHFELLAEAIYDACRGDADTQFFYIAKHMGPRGKEMVKLLANYIERRATDDEVLREAEGKATT